MHSYNKYPEGFEENERKISSFYFLIIFVMQQCTKNKNCGSRFEGIAPTMFADIYMYGDC